MATSASITSPASKFALTGMLLVALLAGGAAGLGARVARRLGRRRSRPASQESSIALASCRRRAGKPIGPIRQGGPFRYDKDGAVFGNRERLLPRERRGYYREYTVETPGSRDRGARRIVCGGAAPGAACLLLYR